VCSFGLIEGVGIDGGKTRLLTRRSLNFLPYDEELLVETILSSRTVVNGDLLADLNLSFLFDPVGGILCYEFLINPSI